MTTQSLQDACLVFERTILRKTAKGTPTLDILFNRVQDELDELRAAAMDGGTQDELGLELADVLITLGCLSAFLKLPRGRWYSFVVRKNRINAGREWLAHPLTPGIVWRKK